MPSTQIIESAFELLPLTTMPATVWKGYLSFGLVSFPIRLFAAARPEAIHFHMLYKKDESRVKEVWFCAGENKQIEKADIVKGYEYAKGKYIRVDDEELKKVAPPTATTMEILQFVKSDEVDPIYFEKSYYVAPEEATSKPYGLFRKALADSGYDAVAKVTMHGREHIVVIRTVDDGLVLHTVYFASELNEGTGFGLVAGPNSARRKCNWRSNSSTASPVHFSHGNMSMNTGRMWSG